MRNHAICYIGGLRVRFSRMIQNTGNARVCSSLQAPVPWTKLWVARRRHFVVTALPLIPITSVFLCCSLSPHLVRAYAEATGSEIVLLFRILFSGCALWRYEGFSVAAPFWRYYACSQCGWLMGRVSVHRQFQFNTRRSAGKEKSAEFNLFLRNFYE